MAGSPPVVYENRVRFVETDQQGVVFYGVYFTYMDEAFNEYVRRLGYDYERMAEAGWTTHVVHADLDFHAAAGFGDAVENRLRVASIGGASLTAEYEARRADDGTLLADGSVVHVAVDADGDEKAEDAGEGSEDATDDGGGAPVDVPEAFREAVADFQSVPPDDASGGDS